jgi:hypothetical protein
VSWVVAGNTRSLDFARDDRALWDDRVCGMTVFSRVDWAFAGWQIFRDDNFSEE